MSESDYGSTDVSIGRPGAVVVARRDELREREPFAVWVGGVDLVVVRFGPDPADYSVLFGRCQHRGALVADGTVVGDDIVCGVHGWDDRVDTGVSTYASDQQLHRFRSWVDDGGVMVNADEIDAYRRRHGLAKRTERPSEYDVQYDSAHHGREEPLTGEIHELAKNGLDRVGHHGPMVAMGVPRARLPSWGSIQFVTTEVATRSKLDDVAVGTDVVIGPNADAPLHLEIPIFVSDMSFGALSTEAKVALARGADQAGTGIGSGEGGMLPEEHDANRRYFCELASARFGWSPDLLAGVQAFHPKSVKVPRPALVATYQAAR